MKRLLAIACTSIACVAIVTPAASAAEWKSYRYCATATVCYTKATVLGAGSSTLRHGSATGTIETQLVYSRPYATPLSMDANEDGGIHHWYWGTDGSLSAMSSGCFDASR